MPDDVFSDAMADLADTIGDAATFTPSGGDPVACHVDLSSEVEEQPDGLSAGAWPQTQTVEALLSEIGAEPNRGDVFTIAGTDYTVKRVMENDNIFVKMAVK